MQKLPKLLLVEDDRTLTSTLKEALKNTYAVDLTESGKDAIYKTDVTPYDVILLGLSLTDLTGLETCQLLRERSVTSPILIISGDNDVLTKIKLLDAGANDYLAKPFSLGELKARLRVLIRSSQQAPQLMRNLRVGDIDLNRHSYSVTRSGQHINLRRKEFALLEYMMQNAGSVVTRNALGRYVWQDNTLWTNTVDVHIKHLRDKIDRPFEQALIKTVHGVGYKLEALSESTS